MFVSHVNDKIYLCVRD